MILKRAAALVILGIAVSFSGCGSEQEQPADAPSTEAPATLRFNIDPVGLEGVLVGELAEEFEAHTGIRVEPVEGPSSATERLLLYRQYMGARSSEIDVYQVDVIWPGMLAEHLVNVSEMIEDPEVFFRPILENNTVDGRVVAVPWFGDVGVLFYRTDLLEQYGFDAPPETWEELESMARMIMEGERAAGNESFHGYIWQGLPREALTCNALEWIASEGGGTMVDDQGTVTINNPKAAAAVERALSWIGTISPREVLEWGAEDCREVFQAGNAAFMRNWAYPSTVMEVEEDSEVKGRFGVAQMPAGDAGRAACLGGWQISVSAYSPNPEAAKQFAAFMATERAQRKVAMSGFLPARRDVYDDPELRERYPFLEILREEFRNAVARPSTVTGDRYNTVSTIIYRGIHRILSEDVEVEAGLAEIEQQVTEALR
jgi:trehalose/maltose transport system substrate-binding protein